MADQYTGEKIVGLMRQVDKSLKCKPGTIVSDPKVEVGGMLVTVDGVEITFRLRSSSRGSGSRPRNRLQWQAARPLREVKWFTEDPAQRAYLIAVASAAGLPDIFE